MMNNGKIAVIIPARYHSVRLPGKPLIEINGKPVIQWVYEQANKSGIADMVIIATDDTRIKDSAEKFGGDVCLTSSKHQSGSDRIAEVVKKYPEISIAVNVQGDEPLICPKSIDKAIQALIDDETMDISTLIREIKDKEEIQNPNLVKVVIDKYKKAMYFSRSPIPYERQPGNFKFYAHIGLYAYRRQSLLEITSLEQSDLEKTECLEQLRALQNGFSIKTIEVDYTPIGIDTPEDLEKFRQLAENKGL